jgi:hypothetical protein
MTRNVDVDASLQKQQFHHFCVVWLRASQVKRGETAVTLTVHQGTAAS